MGLSNDTICMLVAQGAAKLPEVKVGGTKKKIRDSNPGRTRVVKIGPRGRIFLRPSTLTLGSSAVS